MTEMRKKLSAGTNLSSAADIKKSSGGLTDIEFIVSYLLLTNYHYVKKCIGAGTQKSVNILSLDKQIKINLDKMTEYFRTLKNIELANKILFDTRTSRIPANEIQLKKLSLFLDYKDHKSFLNELNNVLVKNAKFYSEVFTN
jgi:glutamine synthetase adenylyltransferase